jgi:hypothetical protein
MSVASAAPVSQREADFAALLEKVHAIGRDIVATRAFRARRSPRSRRRSS